MPGWRTPLCRATRRSRAAPGPPAGARGPWRKYLQVTGKIFAGLHLLCGVRRRSSAPWLSGEPRPRSVSSADQRRAETSRITSSSVVLRIVHYIHYTLYIIHYTLYIIHQCSVPPPVAHLLQPLQDLADQVLVAPEQREGVQDEVLLLCNDGNSETQPPVATLNT